MRLMGIGLVIFGLVLSGAAAAHGVYHSGPIKFCHSENGTEFKPGDYCYTSCAPKAACYLEVCYSDGSLLKVFPCMQRDCRKLC